MSTALPSSTTIARYIARFRQERPRPREERVRDVRSDDFWWMRHDASPSSSSSKQRRDDGGGGASLSSIASVSAASASLEWENQLWAELSAITSINDEETSHGHGSVAPPPPLIETAAPPAPAPASPPPPPSLTLEADTASETVACSPSLMDSPIWQQADDPFGAMEEALEDPETVIQRVRRRLGLPFAPAAVPEIESTPQQLSLADLSPSPERSPWPPLELSLSSVEVPLPRPLDCESVLSTPLNIEAESRDLDMKREEDLHATIHEIEEQHEAEEKEAVDREHDAVGTTRDKHKEEEEEQVAKEGDANEETARTQCDNDAEHEESASRLSDDACAFSDAVDNEHQVTEPEMALSSHTGDAQSPTRQEQLTLPSSSTPVDAEQPQLSTPVSVRESPVEQEIPVETAQTLDRLVSFVVHAWGDDVSHSDREEEEEEEEEEEGARNVAEEREVTNESVTSKSAAPSQDEEQDEGDDEAPLNVTDADAEDMIVRLLCDRIALLEAALQRLEATNA